MRRYVSYTDKMSEIIPQSIRTKLLRSEEDPRPVVLMTCGIAGAGKSTLAKSIIAAHPSFTRLSIDSIIHSRHGLYRIDYPPSSYDQYQTEADAEYISLFRQLLQDGKDVVLDRSFYDRGDRAEFKEMVEQAGARWVLVYLKGDKGTLWKRICERRRKGVDADCALEIDERLLDSYLEGFEEPVGEGEVVIHVGQGKMGDGTW